MTTIHSAGGKKPLLLTTSHPLYTYQHLLVKQDELTKVFEDVLANIPIGEEADMILSLSTSNPHTSISLSCRVSAKDLEQAIIQTKRWMKSPRILQPSSQRFLAVVVSIAPVSLPLSTRFVAT